MYSDKWAHQNFVGWYDFFNDIALDVKPDIGHANAEHHPDWPAHRWENGRLVKDAIDIDVLGLKDSEKGLLSMFTIFVTSFNGKRGDKEKTHWYIFQEAVKEHQANAMEDFDSLFAKMGINLHNV